jgi:hypothetical protein
VLVAVAVLSGLLVLGSPAGAANQLQIQGATVLSNMEIQVTGTIACPFGEMYSVSVRIDFSPTQTVDTAYASGSTSGSCQPNGAVTNWLVNAWGQGTYTSGLKAVITASGCVTDGSTPSATKTVVTKRA